MAWHDECPHKVYASALLLDGKIEGWKTGNPPKKEPGEFRAYWKRDRMNDYTVEYVGFEVNNDKEHDDAFRKLAQEWFRQWPLAEDLHGSPPYSDVPEGVVGTRDEILAMVPGPELDEAVGKAIGATPTVKWYAMNEEETAYCMDFERENTARDWLSDIVTRFPDSRYEDYHIVRQEIYRQYSKDISAAWGVVEKADLPFLLGKSFENDFRVGPLGWNVTWCKEPACDPGDRCRHGNDIWVLSAPEAICKAALLAREVPE